MVLPGERAQPGPRTGRPVADAGDASDHPPQASASQDARERVRKASTPAATAAARDAEIDRLRQMNEFKTRFLNMAAHELNTPMTPIRLQIHMLKTGSLGDLSDRQRRAVATLDRNVERLEALVKEVLDVARLDSGKLSIVPATLELDNIIDEVVDSFGETARQVGVALAWLGDRGLQVEGDRNRLLQVLFNLVSNALKFTPAGGQVTLRAYQSGSMTQVEVTDSGLGLGPAQIDRLFQPFSQVHDTSQFTVGGTGLGLYICRGLVRQMGGELQVRSPGPGRGSTFYFTIPSALVHRPTAPTAPIQTAIAHRLRELI